MDKYQALKHYFGHDAFRPGQERMIDALIAGHDALGVMPTGAGKSMCYQIPALVREGVAIVISPLISLMKDQVAALKSAGVPAAYLNSSLTPRQLELATERACQGMYKIIYVAPERLETASFRRFAQAAKISLLAVDEAHCVSQWGQDFRPNYLRIAEFVNSLPQRPVIGAFTATATERVRKDIIRLLELINPIKAVTGFDRPNLYFEVLQPKNRYTALRNILKEKRNQYGIVYCATRKNVEEIADKLMDDGFLASAYHAGMSDEDRQRSQEDFQYDRTHVMVATNAFGMGIDKSNVNYVIHYNMPKSMEAYYQEAGRAGRDGEAADCILLYSGQDIFTAKWMIEHGEPNEELTEQEQAQVRRQDYARLNAMIDYCNSTDCLRGYILRYFGETAPEKCGHCSVCSGARYVEAALAAKAARTRKPVPAPAEKPARSRSMTIEEAITADPDNLFDLLRACRLQLAKQAHVPPYIVCDDKTLHDMMRRMPQSTDELLEVHGMGSAKVSRYGKAFLNVVRSYAQAHPQWGGAKVTATVRKKTKRLVWTGEEDRWLRDMYMQGARIADLAVEFDRTPAAVRQRLKELNLVM